MGFPLSTDIFGQLKWLIKQVKLLVFRVTRLEHGGGGGGSQTLDQVLATGNTATDKTLKIVDTTQGTAELHGNYLKITSPAFPQFNTTYAYQQIGINTDSGTYIGIGTGSGPSGIVSGMSIISSNGNNTSYDGEHVIVTDTSSNQTQLTSTFLTFIKTGTPTMLIGNTSGYAGGIGFTITNDTGNSVSCDPTQYVINTSGVTNNITADSITVNSTYPGSFPVALKFDPRYSTLYTEFGGYQFGLNLASALQTYTIGEELAGNEYFGIDTSNARLMGGGIHQSGAHFAPNGYVEIIIDGTQYWIELWT
jgi:hypothetical protein